MTVITALKHNGRVFMASDSMSSDSSGLIWDGSGKIFEKLCGDGTRLICGNTGNSSACAIFEHALKIGAGPLPVEGGDNAWAQQVAFDYTSIARQMHEVDRDGDVTISLLVACGEHAWEITDNFAQSIEHYASVGSGSKVAQGALWCRLDAIDGYTPTFNDDQAEMYIKDAVRSACRWDRSCREPVQVLST